MKRLLAISLTAASILIFAPQAMAAPCCSIGWHWRRTANPFNVTLVLSITTAWQTPLNAAANEWSTRSGKFDFVTTPGSTTRSARQNCAMTSGAVHVCNGHWNAAWAGLTEARVSGHHILAMRIRLNDAQTPARYRRLVSCHELGHSVGLAHNTRPSSCMRPGISRPHPDATDIAELNVIYRHLDGMSPTTADNSAVRTIRIAWYAPQ